MTYIDLKYRFVYHILLPIIFVSYTTLFFRIGAGKYSGEIIVFGAVMFVLSSIVADHKKQWIDILLWSLIRLISYTIIALGVSIFLKEIIRRFF